jgi:hypothetical protein
MDPTKNTTQKTKEISNTDPTKNTTQKTKEISNTDPIKNRRLQRRTKNVKTYDRIKCWAPLCANKHKQHNKT